jgi:hypothetical protein
MVEQQPSKLMTRVRFPSPAPRIFEPIEQMGESYPPRRSPISKQVAWHPHPLAPDFIIVVFAARVPHFFVGGRNARMGDCPLSPQPVGAMGSRDAAPELP